MHKAHILSCLFFFTILRQVNSQASMTTKRRLHWSQRGTIKHFLYNTLQKLSLGISNLYQTAKLRHVRRMAINIYQLMKQLYRLLNSRQGITS